MQEWYPTIYTLVRATHSNADPDAKCLDNRTGYFVSPKRVLFIHEVLQERKPGKSWKACLRELYDALVALDDELVDGTLNKP